MALILTTTGISLLAYMDGVTVQSTTLSAVLIASASAAGSAVYKVMFKKVMGCVTFSQVPGVKNNVVFSCAYLSIFSLSDMKF